MEARLTHEPNGVIEDAECECHVRTTLDSIDEDSNGKITPNELKAMLERKAAEEKKAAADQEAGAAAVGEEPSSAVKHGSSAGLDAAAHAASSRSSWSRMRGWWARSVLATSCTWG